MIENARAGRLIGQKGSTLQSLKTNSNLMTLHLTNEPVVSRYKRSLMNTLTFIFLGSFCGPIAYFSLFLIFYWFCFAFFFWYHCYVPLSLPFLSFFADASLFIVPFDLLLSFSFLPPLVSGGAWAIISHSYSFRTAFFSPQVTYTISIYLSIFPFALCLHILTSSSLSVYVVLFSWVTCNLNILLCPSNKQGSLFGAWSFLWFLCIDESCGSARSWTCTGNYNGRDAYDDGSFYSRPHARPTPTKWFRGAKKWVLSSLFN